MENGTALHDILSIAVVGLDFEILSDEQAWHAQQAARSPFRGTVFRRYASRLTRTSRAGTCQDACLRTTYVVPSLGTVPDIY